MSNRTFQLLAAACILAVMAGCRSAPKANEKLSTFTSTVFTEVRSHDKAPADSRAMPSDEGSHRSASSTLLADAPSPDGGAERVSASSSDTDGAAQARKEAPEPQNVVRIVVDEDASSPGTTGTLVPAPDDTTVTASAGGSTTGGLTPTVSARPAKVAPAELGPVVRLEPIELAPVRDWQQDYVEMVSKGIKQLRAKPNEALEQFRSARSFALEHELSDDLAQALQADALVRVGKFSEAADLAARLLGSEAFAFWGHLVLGKIALVHSLDFNEAQTQFGLALESATSAAAERIESFQLLSHGLEAYQEGLVEQARTAWKSIPDQETRKEVSAKAKRFLEVSF